MAGKCFVPGCNSGSLSVRRRDKRLNRKHPQVFSAPKNWTMLQIWKQVIPGSATEFSITDKICELHFTRDYVAKFHELPVTDGKVLKMERSYAKLKPGAIPTVFHLFPKYSENVQKIVDQMRKEFPLHIPQMEVKLNDQLESYLRIISEVREMSMVPEEATCEAEKNNSTSEAAVYEAEKNNSNSEEGVYESKKNLIANMSAKETTFCDDELDTENTNESYIGVDTSDINKDVNAKNINSDIMDFEVEEHCANKLDDITFEELVRNVKSVSKPNSSWSVTCHGKFVMCAKWNKEYQPEKRVVIDRDLNIKVFLNDKEIAAYNNCISDISDVSNVLCILDK